MTRPLTRVAIFCGLATCVALSTNSIAYAVADLSGWVGFNNAPPDQDPGDLYGPEENNYTVTSMTSAGGTFKARRTRTTNMGGTNINKAFLADPSLQGSLIDEPDRYGFTEDLSASGTLTFSNPNGADPSFFFGFFNSEPGTTAGIQRIGLSVGDVTAGNFFRVQAAANAGVSGTSSANTLTTTGAAPPTGQDPVGYAPAGTYDFEFSYIGATRMFEASITDGTNTFFRSPITLPAQFNVSDTLDSFGFLQFGDLVSAIPPAANSFTYQFSVSNIDYTGDTDVPGGDPDSADFDGDDDVDGEDLLIFQRGLGLTGQTNNANGDADGSGTIDGLDLQIFQDQFGTDPPSVVAVQGVPEPSTAALLVVGALGAAGRLRRLHSKDESGVRNRAR